MLRMARRSLPLLAAVAASAAALPAAAQDWWSQNFIPPGQETFSLRLGGIANTFDTKVAINGTGRTGTEINLENNGLKKNLSSFELAGTWRFADNHRVDVDWFSAKRSGTRTYTTDISIGDQDFPVGATVNAETKQDFVALDYRYSFIKTPDFEFAGGIGFWGGKFNFDFNAVGTGSAGATTSYSKSVSTTLPLPLLGISADWYFGPQVRLGADFFGIKAKIGDVDGHAYVAGVSGDYMLARNFGLGARYQYVDLQADVTKDATDFNGHFKWRMNSISLYGKFLF